MDDFDQDQRGGGIPSFLFDPIGIVRRRWRWMLPVLGVGAALAAGCAGVVSSGLEAKLLRAGVDDRLIVVTPGIRPVENRPADDQKRVMSVADAFASGVDYIVVGRPIRDAADPRAAAEAIQATIAQQFPRR